MSYDSLLAMLSLSLTKTHDNKLACKYGFTTFNTFQLSCIYENIRKNPFYYILIITRHMFKMNASA